MKYVYTALLLHSAGKAVDEENMKKIFESVGLEVDEARVRALVAALSEVNIDEALKAAPIAPAQAPAAQATSAPEKKEEKKKEEKKEEEAVAGLSGLFG